MPKICYRTFRFKPETLACVAAVNAVINELAADGYYKLSLRQVYYRLVAKDLFPDDRKFTMVGSGKWVRDPAGTKNAEPNYKWLGDVVSDGRMAGMLDWDAIEDRNRELEQRSHWDSPGKIIETCAKAYNRDLWENQPFHPEVWIEKAALAGVFDPICTANDVPYFACRGYSSQSALWEAGQRLLECIRNEQKVLILHFGDHDPSGLDMTRDIEDRLKVFLAYHTAADQGYDPDDPAEREYGMDHVSSYFEVRRIALTKDQIDEFVPPPNPVKQTDSRWQQYVQDTGLNESWELDALDPPTLVDLVEEALLEIRDEDRWKKDTELEAAERAQLQKAADQWPKLLKHLK
jgi:hypothetical protein